VWARQNFSAGLANVALGAGIRFELLVLFADLRIIGYMTGHLTKNLVEKTSPPRSG
jgi:hypothetical protein